MIFRHSYGYCDNLASLPPSHTPTSSINNQQPQKGILPKLAMRRAARGMNSLLAAVEVASNHSSPPNHTTATDRTTTVATASTTTATVQQHRRMNNNIVVTTPDEPRKGARVFTSDERAILEDEYKLNKFPTRIMMESFASRLRKPTEKVRTWFNNRRAFDRKQGVDVVRVPMNRTLSSNVGNNIIHNSATPSASTTTQTIAITAQQQQQRLENNVKREHVKSLFPQPPVLPAPPPTPPNIPPIANTNAIQTAPTSSSLETSIGIPAKSSTLAVSSGFNGSVVPSMGIASTPRNVKQKFTTTNPIPTLTLTPETPSRSPTSSRNLTPSSAIRRISNVTPAHSIGTPNRITPLRSSAGRPRLTPVRLRNARLRLGSSELKGEGHTDDVGLEVKFLFGKKRLVYEWYCGENYADAKVTGGPYAKMETNFDSLYSMKFVRTRDGSIIEMTLSDTPALYRQSDDNMHKFKVRSQQRQYQRASINAFNVDVSAKDHRIFLRSDEAARVRKTILDSVPELAALVQESTPLPGAQLCGTGAFDTPISYRHSERHTDTESVSAAAGRGDVPKHPGVNNAEISNHGMVTPRPSKAPSEPSSFKSDVRQGPQTSNPENVKDSKDNANVKSETRTPIASGAHVWETPTRSNIRIGRKRTADQALGPGASNPSCTAGPSNAAFLIPTPATPAPWHSPATPFNSEARTTSNAHLWLASGAAITPISEQPQSGESQPAVPLVRRALDFTPGKGTKRNLEVSDENDSSSGNKPAKKKVRGAPPPPPPPVPPALPPVPPELPGQSSADEISKTASEEQAA